MIFSIKKGPLDIYFKKCAFRIFGGNNLIEYGLLLDPNYNNLDIDFLLDGARFRIKFCRFRIKYWFVFSTFGLS